MHQLLHYIETNLQPKVCNSEEFFYNEMDSQSGYSLPVIYLPFNAADRSHWRDRGALFDFLYAVEGEGKRLLDFGPGDGWPSLIVAPYAGEVIGVDGSAQRVAVCTQNAARLGITNARFLRVEPGCPLPFPEGYFDGVMAASSIEQTPDPRFTLRELFRVLKPDGRLRMHYENLGAYRDGHEREAELSPDGENACWLTLYDRQIEQEKAVMAKLGFNLPIQEVIQHFSDHQQLPLWDCVTIPQLEKLRSNIIETRTLTLTHPSGETYVRWLKEIGFRKALTTHDGQVFAGQVFDQLSADERPQNIAGVDTLLRPLVKIVVQMESPARRLRGWDPMITAVK